METKDTMNTQESMDIETLFVHGGTEGDPKTGAVIVPIFQTSTYEQEGIRVYEKRQPDEKIARRSHRKA